jgi:hypothetical protein
MTPDEAAKKDIEFPRYLMKIGENIQKFLPIEEAGKSFDNGFSVEIVGLVLLEDFTARGITPEERLRIGEFADEYEK